MVAACSRNVERLCAARARIVRVAFAPVMT